MVPERPPSASAVAPTPAISRPPSSANSPRTISTTFLAMLQYPSENAAINRELHPYHQILAVHEAPDRRGEHGDHPGHVLGLHDRGRVLVGGERTAQVGRAAPGRDAHDPRAVDRQLLL